MADLADSSGSFQEIIHSLGGLKHLKEKSSMDEALKRIEHERAHLDFVLFPMAIRTEGQFQPESERASNGRSNELLLDLRFVVLEEM